MNVFRPQYTRALRASPAQARRLLGARYMSDIKPDPFMESAPKVVAKSDATPLTSPSLVPQEPLQAAVPAHAPDYSAHVDHGTSTFSPIPKRVMDGSEPGEVVAAAVLSGAPIDLQARTVRIFKPSKPATQSGTWGSHHWRMDWDVLSKGHRWENPLIGWQSSADAMQGTHLNFKSKEDAIRFAEKQGYEYFVQEPNERRFVVKVYADNFVHEPKPLKHIKTK